MSKNKKNNHQNIERKMYIINIDKEKVYKTTEENEKNINIIEDCKKFCETYSNIDFKRKRINDLKNISDEGSGLLDTYFITKEENENKENESFIIQLEYIIMSANYELITKQMEKTRRQAIELNEKLSRTIHNTKRIEKDAKARTQEIKHIRNDIKSIITTILAIVLTFSIIPTAITALTNIDANYIIPFIASIAVFGMIMVIFIYSIYQDKLKTSTWVILVISIVICIILWICSIYRFNDISKNTEEQQNNVQEVTETSQ